ncbi:CoA-binding protein [Limnohabitans sp.]|uniref:CoA-binding protein n=1 Tax=Limnohabitans sp. TaxID=1907725 RepID=UPI0038BE1AF6
MSPEQLDIHPCLRQCRTIAVVGLSPKPHRDSYRVSQYMQSHGYRIIPVNPLAKEVLGERAYASLSEAAQHAQIDMVNCFRNAQDIPPIADEAIAIGAKTLWLQIGISHADAATLARQAGLWVVQNRCLMVEHARWGRHLP